MNLEELVVASSGENEFDEIFKLIVAKLWDERSGKATRFYLRSTELRTFEAITSLLRETEKAWPGILEVEPRPHLHPEHLHVCVGALARHSIGGQDLQVLDGFFEYLVSKAAKGAKGQYFTPRHIVEFCVRVLRPSRSDVLCDPGCGSGGFLLHSMKYVAGQERFSAGEVGRYCRSNVWGFDIDSRAVRVAKALMLIAGGGEANLFRLNSLMRPEMGSLFPMRQGEMERGQGDSLLTIEDVCRSRMRHHNGFDLILTNPPFAGEVRERQILDGYQVSLGKARVERDILFIERCIELLRPGGRLAIVLPHNKFASAAFSSVRELAMRRTRVIGVVGLGRHTFLPHTHQKASVLFLQRRMKGERRKSNEKVFFAISAKDGKDSKGRFLLRDGISPKTSAWHVVDHDLDQIVSEFHRFLDKPAESNGTRSTALFSVRKVAELGPSLVLSPERYDPRRSRLERIGDAARLGEIVGGLNVTVNPNGPRGPSRYLVLNTSDAREGVVVCRKQAVSLKEVGSTKKSVEHGCVLISRLRPYLRQVAYVDDRIPGWTGDIRLVCSPEFFVLQPIDGRPISFLVPFLLSGPVQAVLAAAQEGGHHPRFDKSTLLNLPIPKALMERREADSASVEQAIALFRNYEDLKDKLVADAAATFGTG